MKSPELDVRYVARLARLDLSDEEVARFEAQLGDVVEYVSTLDRADVSGIDLTVTAADAGNRTRPDEPAPGLTTDEALADAPARAGDEFLTVRVVD
jgi:aspartyl-tRNA(Asn)/glutamyl-tRNA(Gln) amidotransferase subunit C